MLPSCCFFPLHTKMKLRFAFCRRVHAVTPFAGSSYTGTDDRGSDVSRGMCWCARSCGCVAVFGSLGHYQLERTGFSAKICLWYFSQQLRANLERMFRVDRVRTSGLLKCSLHQSCCASYLLRLARSYSVLATSAVPTAMSAVVRSHPWKTGVLSPITNRELTLPSPPLHS